jgi:large subunit ribosomal protein L13
VNTLSYKTKSISNEAVEKKWLIVDAAGQTLGRFSSKVAYVLRGKHKTSYTPHIDCGDNVIILNAKDITVTGDKLNSKEYVRHTGYPGGQRITVAKNMLKDRPERMLEKAIKGMLPKNKLGREIFRSLYVYEGSEHPHQGQDPQVFNLDTLNK